MKAVASITIAVEITPELILKHADYTHYSEQSYGNPQVTEDSIDEEIKEYFEKNKNDIIQYAKDRAYDEIVDIVDDVCLRQRTEWIELTVKDGDEQ